MELLLSLQSAAELQIAIGYKFRWLDLKNPLAGSLGCPETSVARDFLESAERFPNRNSRTLSVAIGELLEGNGLSNSSDNDASKPFRLPLPAELLHRFDYVKVALTGSQNETSWRELAWSLSRQLRQPSQLILVHYADHHLAKAVDWKSTLAASHELGCEYLLIDTFDKKAGRMMDWLSTDECSQYAIEAQRLGLKLSLAGSLRIEDFGPLEETGASILGIRGAACVDGSRISRLCRDRLRELSSCFTTEKLAT